MNVSPTLASTAAFASIVSRTTCATARTATLERTVKSTNKGKSSGWAWALWQPSSSAYWLFSVSFSFPKRNPIVFPTRCTMCGSVFFENGNWGWLEVSFIIFSVCGNDCLLLVPTRTPDCSKKTIWRIYFIFLFSSHSIRRKFLKSPRKCWPSVFRYFCYYDLAPLFFSCPAGQSKYGSSCRDVDECAWRPCRRFGSTCVNYQDERGYECICPLGYMGKHCDLEVMTSATITTSTDFIIAIIACLATLLRMCLVTKIRTLLFPF